MQSVRLVDMDHECKHNIRKASHSFQFVYQLQLKWFGNSSWVRETRDPGLIMPLRLAVDIYFISVTLVAGRGNFKPSVSILQEIPLSLVISAIYLMWIYVSTQITKPFSP